MTKFILLVTKIRKCFYLQRKKHIFVHESYLNQWKKKADRSLSLVFKSLPIVYFPFLKT